MKEVRRNSELSHVSSDIFHYHKKNWYLHSVQVENLGEKTLYITTFKPKFKEGIKLWFSYKWYQLFGEVDGAIRAAIVIILILLCAFGGAIYGLAKLVH